ncbi:2-amino-4-hydroxy-6-hydroxymethyldihydropteridine diphosphokinase [Bacteroidota bacterium]
MNKVFLLLGGNLGNRFKLLEQAKKSIKVEIGIIKLESSIYETTPWKFVADQDFLNQVIQINTNLKPYEVLNKCLKIEKDLGRERKSDQYESRIIDIDILFFNYETISEKDLVIPHPRLHERRFTLEPLAEIAPEFVHPFFNQKIKSLLKECKDDSMVKKL